MVSPVRPPDAPGIAEEDRPFQHYTWKHRLVAWISQTLFDWPVYRVSHGPLRGLRRKGGLGWATAVLSPGADSGEDRFLARLADSGTFRNAVVYDIGGFHGLKTMFFARAGAKVIVFEPMSRNRRRLLRNLELNGMTALVRDVALGADAGTATLTISPLMPAGGSLDSSIAEGISRGTNRMESVQVTTLDADQAAMEYPPPSFMKIDVEGFELNVLRGADGVLRRHRPALFIEMHGETIREKREKIHDVVAFLIERGYMITHVETGERVTVENAGYERSHLYCTCA